MLITAYLHSSKESMLDRGTEAGLSEAALDNFKYMLSEVEFTLKVDEETGEAEIIEVNGRHLGLP